MRILRNQKKANIYSFSVLRQLTKTDINYRHSAQEEIVFDNNYLFQDGSDVLFQDGTQFDFN
jgi:hypothetical protein